MSYRVRWPIQRAIAVHRQDLCLPAAGQIHLLAALRVCAGRGDRAYRHICRPARLELDRYRTIGSRIRMSLYIRSASCQSQAKQRNCGYRPCTSNVFHRSTSFAFLFASAGGRRVAMAQPPVYRTLFTVWSSGWVATSFPGARAALVQDRCPHAALPLSVVLGGIPLHNST